MHQKNDTKKSADEYWPCQRLRLGIGLGLFLFVEMLLIQKLPIALDAVMMGICVATWASAIIAVKRFKMEQRLVLVREAIQAFHAKNK